MGAFEGSASHRARTPRGSPEPPPWAAARSRPGKSNRPSRRLCMRRELVESCWPNRRWCPSGSSMSRPTEMEHPGLRKVIEALYGLHAEGHNS